MQAEKPLEIHKKRMDDFRFEESANAFSRR